MNEIHKKIILSFYKDEDVKYVIEKKDLDTAIEFIHNSYPYLNGTIINPAAMESLITVESYAIMYDKSYGYYDIKRYTSRASLQHHVYRPDQNSLLFLGENMNPGPVSLNGAGIDMYMVELYRSNTNVPTIVYRKV